MNRIPKLICWAATILAGFWVANAQNSGQSDAAADAMVEKSVAANAADFAAAPDFNYKETDRTPDGPKTYQITMIEGSPYRRLLSIKGHPLTPDRAREEQTKQDEEVAKRKAESSTERQSRIQKYQQGRDRDHAMLGQLTKAFQFRLVGRRRVRSFDTWLLAATPRPGYSPPNMETQALVGMKGQLWLDRKTFQWVKVTARVTRPVSIEGFLAQVEPGTRFELDKAPVNGDIWLKSHFIERARARILFVIPHSESDDETYFDFQPVKSAPPTR